MRNSAKAKMKYSKLERQTNKTIGIMLLLSIFIALIGAVVGSMWTMKYGGSVHYIFGLEPPFPNKLEHGFGYYLIQLTGTWVLIFTNFVPISLMVTLELVKFWQAMFMAKDWTMFDDL